MARHQHLHFDPDRTQRALRRLREQMPDIGGRPGLVPDRHRGIHDGLIHQRAQEQNRIEQVGLADGIGTGNAGEGSERQVDADQVLEAVDTQTR